MYLYIICSVPNYDWLYNSEYNMKYKSLQCTYVTCYITCYITHNLVFSNICYILGYIYVICTPLESGTQICCWDVINNKFLGYITWYITCKVLYSIFFCLYNGSDQLLGSIIPFFLGYVGKNWRHNQLCTAFGRLI